jgi:hypothetical protein
MTNEMIINRLLQIEAWAEGLREECHKTRKLMEGGVSTPTNNQPLSHKQIAHLLARKNKHLLKNRNKKPVEATTGSISNK